MPEPSGRRAREGYLEGENARFGGAGAYYVNNMKEGVAYVRVSKEDENPLNQILEIKKWAENNNIRIVKEFVDYDTSGAIPPRSRKAYKSMLEFCKKNNIRVIIFYDLSRLARNIEEGLREILKLEEEGYTIYTLDNIFQTLNQIEYKSIRKILLSLLLGFAEWYREDIIRRTKAGLERAKKEGKHIGRIPKLSEEDMILIKSLRDRGWSWWRIRKEFKEVFKKDVSIDTIKRAYEKAKSRTS